MTAIAPLLFAQTLHSPGLWEVLGRQHSLSERDFRWLAHISLASHTLRSAQTPPMLAERILVSADQETAVPLAGAFVLSATPDEHAQILYTPYAGIKKYDSRLSLETDLKARLEAADADNDLLAFVAFSQSKRLVDAKTLTLTFETIVGEVFEAQKEALLQARQINAQALIDELKQLPSLATLLNQALEKQLQPEFGPLAHRYSRLSFYTLPEAANEFDQTQTRYWLDSMSLSEALLKFYRAPYWPSNQQREFSNPGRIAEKNDQQTWARALRQASNKLPALLFEQLEAFWDGPCADGSPRRMFFANALTAQARTELLLKREAQIISADQFDALHLIIKPVAGTRRPVTETLHVWEHPANYVEPAGSLMLGDTSAFLYTPSSGLQVLADYADLKDTVLSKFSQPGHEDEMYALLNLEERARYQGFEQPSVSGESIAGETFNVLFERILTKQRQNVLYALQVFRHSDGAVDIDALCDQALDIRAMIHDQLLSLDSNGRWSTRPVFASHQQPSSVLAEAARLASQRYDSVADALDRVFSNQPVTTQAAQRTYLESLKETWANALSVGIRAEARMRHLQGDFSAGDKAIVEAVFDASVRSRRERKALNGFRPDAYAITLQVSGESQLLPLAGCFLLTERGGLDDQHSGRVLTWTPALGLQCFAHLNEARLALGHLLDDSARRQVLLENLSPDQWRYAQHYQLGPFRLIEEDVLHNRVESAISHLLARSENLRLRISDSNKLAATLKSLTRTAGHTNLLRAAALSRAIEQQQTLPAWLGMAPVKEQQLQFELLEQWHNSVTDNKDYLDGVPHLPAYIKQRLKSLLDARFPGEGLDPELIEITPNLALAGPTRSLSEFALNHVNVAQGTGFKVTSKTPKAIPAKLDQQAVRQLLLSLNTTSTYAAKVSEKLSENSVQGLARKQRFFRQLPWQLLQHAHGLKLQRQLSETAFDLICQVLDIPDGIARATVSGAHAVVSPLSLIKTAGAETVKTLGLYVLAPGSGQQGPSVLFAPYSDPVFHEYENATKLIAALNTPGTLQELLLRRLPETHQAGFRSLLQSSVGETSEMNLGTQAITGHFLEQLFSDNLSLLKQFIGCQAKSNAQADWEAAKHVLSEGIQRASGLLPGKLAYVPFLWQAYKDFKASAENLQNHHWKRALRSFIDGAVEMVSLGRLTLEDTPPKQTSTETATDVEKTPVQNPKKYSPDWQSIKPTAPLRTQLQAFEAQDVALKDLSHDAKQGTYLNATDKKSYAAIDGKVLRVRKNGAALHVYDGTAFGPGLSRKDDVLILDPAVRTVRAGKVLSTFKRKRPASAEAREALNIQAQGMKEIRRKHPLRAWMLVQAIDVARYYAFNSLHNLAQLKKKVSNTRLETFLKFFFDVPAVDANLLAHIHEVIVPICNALVDPAEDLMNTDRFVIGTNKYPGGRMSAFVLDDDPDKKVHFSELFFEPNLDWYKTGTTEPFNVDGHAQAALLIHEFAHLVGSATDITMLESRRPFADLISTATPEGLALKQGQQQYQREALSLATPRAQLFGRWDSEEQDWVGLEAVEGLDAAAACEGILKATSSVTLDAARSAFLDRKSALARIKTILINADSVAMLICEMGRKLDG